MRTELRGLNSAITDDTISLAPLYANMASSEMELNIFRYPLGRGVDFTAISGEGSWPAAKNRESCSRVVLGLWIDSLAPLRKARWAATRSPCGTEPTSGVNSAAITPGPLAVADDLVFNDRSDLGTRITVSSLFIIIPTQLLTLIGHLL